MDDDKTVEDRVASGIEWLNWHGPSEWWDRVRLPGLDMREGDSCVLGWVFASEAAITGFPNGYNYALSIISQQFDDIGQAWYMGFSDYDAPGVDRYRQLQDEWVEQIKKIRYEVSA